MSTSLYGNSNVVTMLSDNGYESSAILLLTDDTLDLERYGDQRIVRKIYNEQHYQMRAQTESQPWPDELVWFDEINWYWERPIPWMPKLVRYGMRSQRVEFIDVTYAGVPVQKDGGDIIVPDLLKFAEWLNELESALKSAGVNHSDLHGENILVDEQGNFSVIDWSLASHGLKPKRIEQEPILGDDSKQFAVWRECLEKAGIRAR